MIMTEADIDRCLAITDDLRCDLGLRVGSPAVPMIQRRMLAGFAEGFRRGFVLGSHRDDLDDLVQEAYRVFSQAE